MIVLLLLLLLVSPAWASITSTGVSGTLACAQLPALTGDVTKSAGSCTTVLTSTTVAAGSYGDGTHVSAFTVGADGRLTAASSVLITGTAPGGAAGGDLSGTYPSPTVAKVNAVAYPASPSTNTVPVVTGANTVTYEAVPNAALANSAVTLNAGANTGLTAPGAMSLGSTYTVGATTDALHFARLGLGAAADATAPLLVEKDAIGITSTDGILLTNTQAATSGLQQWSPRLHFVGHGWNTGGGGVSQTSEWIVEDRPARITSSVPLPRLYFAYQTNGLGYTDVLQLNTSGINVTGDVTVTGTIAPAYLCVNCTFTSPSAGMIASTLAANNITALSIQRFTNTSPTGKFIDLLSASASALFTVDITGTITVGAYQGTAVAAAYGGTGQTSYTKGDILVATGATTLVKLAVGANDALLAADSTQTSGLRWNTITYTGTGGIVVLQTSPSITTPAITGGTLTGLTGLAIRDTSAAFDVTLAATSSTALTAGRTFTLDLVNAARTLKLTGNPTLADWFDQSVKTTASPTFDAPIGTTSVTAPLVKSAAGAALALTATAPAAITTAQAGSAITLTASAAVAGSSVAGAATGGGFTFTAGAAARLTSGNANGGSFTFIPGQGIGTGSPGAFIVNASTTGSVVLGQSTITSLAHYVGKDATNAAVFIDGYGSSPSFMGRNAAGTQASPTAALSGAYLFGLGAFGYGATGFISGSSGLIAPVSIYFRANQNFTDSATGTRIELSTTTNSTTTNAVRFIVGNSGTVTVGLTEPATALGGALFITGVTQANLGTPSNGHVIYCSDCKIDNPCAGGGTGAIAKRLNAVWVCN